MVHAVSDFYCDSKMISTYLRVYYDLWGCNRRCTRPSVRPSVRPSRASDFLKQESHINF